MKNYFSILVLFFLFLLSCNSKKSFIESSEKNVIVKNDTVRIVNEELQYEVIIIDIGFSAWLAGQSFPRGYLSQSYMENKNIFYVTEWNNRVMQPQRHNPNLYEMSINYDRNIDYGYEVNYLIYNYFIYFQNTYNQRLYGNVPIR